MWAVRTAAVDAIRHLDHLVGRSSSIRVLVDVRTPMNLAVLRPVWRTLLDDPRVAIAFTAEDHASVAQALAGDRLQGALIGRERAAWSRWDLAVTADAWNDANLHRCRRRLKFFHGVAGKYDLDNPRALAAAALERFDRVAFIDRERMRRYVTAGLVSEDRAVLVGYPKGDALVNGTWPAAHIRTGLGLSPSTHTVLYAPTFSTASSLHLAGPEIISALLATGSNVIVKLHDRSTVPDARHTAGVDWPARLASFLAHPRFALARDADASPFLSAADLLVTDHSSVGFEFALLDRPIVVYDAPDLKAAARIDPDKWSLLRSMADVVHAPEHLGPAIALARANPARLSAERGQARALFAYPGSATERALDLVYQLLEIEPLPGRSHQSRSANPAGLAAQVR